MNQKKIFQFRINLRDSWPQIWRRIQVPSTETFKTFQTLVNRAVGWYGFHDHYFTVQNTKTNKEVQIGCIDDSYTFVSSQPEDESSVKLDKYVVNEGDSFRYMYDTGDSWEHDIILEKILPAQQGICYPICIAGERACPPEDCGGVFGYEHFLECISNPENGEHNDMLEWIKGHFDPDDFECQHVCIKHNQLQNKAVQMKITIKGTNPEIWRRIQIAGSMSFQGLNATIQRLMGWSGNHPHVFIVEKGRTFGKQHKFKGIPQPTESADTVVSKLVEWDWKGAYYPFLYKYGSDMNVWELEIINEKFCHLRPNVAYPILLAGELASPPDDCGGVSGYNRQLRTMILDSDVTSSQSKTNVKVEYLTFNPKDFNPMDFHLAGKEKRVYQLKVSLKNTDPLIWRRILVPESYTFDELHKTICRAMGWKDCAEYVFITQDTLKKCHVKQVIGVDHDEDGKYLITKSSKKETINFLVKFFKSKLTYIYNFDKSWDHEIEVEANLPQKLTQTYPQVVSGEIACPPEECGGIEDYKSKLKEENFSPKLFDPSTIVFAPELIRIFQFRIVLRTTKPKIWRRIQVSDNISFQKFHQIVSRVIGWKNNHNHLFVVRNPVTTLMERLGDQVLSREEPRTTRNAEMKLKELFWDEKVKGIYKYDYRFDWTWIHDIILEEIRTQEDGVEYPRCLAGEGACPPEMVNGLTPMFGPVEYNFLSDRNHPDYQTLVNIFGKIDYEYFFDPASVTFTQVE